MNTECDFSTIAMGDGVVDRDRKMPPMQRFTTYRALFNLSAGIFIHLHCGR